MFDALHGGLPDVPMSDEEKEKLLQYNKAMNQYREAKEKYDEAVDAGIVFAAKVAAVAAERAAIDANPPASYRDAFTDACMAIDQVRNGNYNTIRRVHPSLRRSKSFMETVAAGDARAIRWGLEFDADDREDMWKDAIVANARNAQWAVPYSQPDYDGARYGNIESDAFYEAVGENPEALWYLPSADHFEFDVVEANLGDILEENPLVLKYLLDKDSGEPNGNFENVYNDECLMLKLAKTDGESLQFMDEYFRSDKRIVMAALDSGGSGVFRWVMGALRRDPEVRALAGVNLLPHGERVRRNREAEEPCTDDESEGEEEPEEYDPNQSPTSDGEDAPMLPADYMSASEGERSVRPAPSLRAIERQIEEEEASSSEEEPESPTSTFDVKLKARNRDDSSSEEEDVSHGMDAGNVMMMADAGEEGASPPLSPTRGDYPDYDNQRALDRSIATMREKRSWR